MVLRGPPVANSGGRVARLERGIADEADKRNSRECDCEHDSGRANAHSDLCRVLSATGEEACDAAQSRSERHARKLPIPVGSGVHEIGDVRCAREWHEWMPSRLERADEWGAEREEEKRKTDRTELGKRLQVEVGRVLHLQRGWAMQKPVALV